MKKKSYAIDGPLLDTVTFPSIKPEEAAVYPLSLPLIQHIKTLSFPTNVTFFVGENGSGKSTILEAIALHAGFSYEGGSKNMYFSTRAEDSKNPIDVLADQLRLSWRKKPKNGFFLKAESFFNVASHIDYLAKEGGGGGNIYDSYGGQSLHHQSHGESFLSFFNNRLGTKGFFILDEPEAALSPQRQLSLLIIINEMCKHKESQFIIATHSPLLLAYPGATIYSCDGDRLKAVSYEQTEHYNLTKRFLDNPERYVQRLFSEQ